MRIKLNGEDLDRNAELTINGKEASNFKAWLVVLIGWALIGGLLLWI